MHSESLREVADFWAAQGNPGKNSSFQAHLMHCCISCTIWSPCGGSISESSEHWAFCGLFHQEIIFQVELDRNFLRDFQFDPSLTWPLVLNFTTRVCHWCSALFTHCKQKFYHHRIRNKNFIITGLETKRKKNETWNHALTVNKRRPNPKIKGKIISEDRQMTFSHQFIITQIVE